MQWCSTAVYSSTGNALVQYSTTQSAPQLLVLTWYIIALLVLIDGVGGTFVERLMYHSAYYSTMKQGSLFFVFAFVFRCRGFSKRRSSGTLVGQL